MIDRRGCEVITMLFGFTTIVIAVLVLLDSGRFTWAAENDATIKSDISFQQLRNLSRINSDRVIYNRVPKCGSYSLISLLTAFSKRSNEKINTVRSFINFSNLQRHPSHNDLRMLVDKIDTIRKPYFYEHHLDFLDFERSFKKPQPLYINMIREPYERMESEYKYTVLAKEHSVNLSHVESTKFLETMHSLYGRSYEYFCDIANKCWQDAETPNPIFLEVAKENIRKSYLLVGVTDKYSEFLEVFEFLLPSYKGILDLYQRLNPRANITPKLSSTFPAKIQEYLQKDLALEKNLYSWVRKRFLSLYTNVKDAKSNGWKDVLTVPLTTVNGRHSLTKIFEFLPERLKFL